MQVQYISEIVRLAQVTFDKSKFFILPIKQRPKKCILSFRKQTKIQTRKLRLGYNTEDTSTSRYFNTIRNNSLISRTKNSSQRSTLELWLIIRERRQKHLFFLYALHHVHS